MEAFTLRRTLAIAKKEVYHIVRDPFVLLMALGLPIFMVVIFGSAIEFNVQNIPISVVDGDRSQSSRRLVESFGSSGYFVVKQVASPLEAINGLTSEEARSVLVIPPEFERKLYSERTAEAQLLLDGSDSSTVVPVLGYVGKIQQRANQLLAGQDLASPLDLKVRYLYNPELNSRWFIIPGLNVLVMGIISILLTALTIAREYENGSMELLLSTPVCPLEIIVGKILPYGLLGVVSVSFVYGIARAGFGVPFVGSHGVFLAGTLIFLASYLGQGLLISVLTRNQQVAMQIAMMSGMLPVQLLSGFVFPIESMPVALQYFTMLLPARWYMEISRDTFLKGSGWYPMGLAFGCLTAFTLFVILRGTLKFKRDLEP